MADDEPRAPIGIEEFRPSRADVDHGELDRREALRPERAVAIGRGPPPEGEGSIAGGEGEKEGKKKKGVAIVVVARPVAHEKKESDERRREKRGPRRAPRGDQKSERQLNDDENGERNARRHEPFGNDGDVKDVAEVSALAEIEKLSQRSVKQQEA